ncbi:MAG: hypothetical protein OEY64_07505 [Nitrospinota bacterium]|nr:hypothetical protein [Nitrospinota bacterium]
MIFKLIGFLIGLKRPVICGAGELNFSTSRISKNDDSSNHNGYRWKNELKGSLKTVQNIFAESTGIAIPVQVHSIATR